MDSFLRNNNLVRLIAFVLAVMLWLVVRGGPDLPEAPASVGRISETISGTPEVLVDKERVTLVGEPPEVTVRIYGDRLAVWQAKMQVNKIKFVVDARNYGEGVHQVPVQVQGLPPGVSYEPHNVSIRLEANVRREYKVELTVEGARAPSAIEGLRAQPAEVTVVGPASLVEQVHQVQARVPAQALESPGTEHTVTVHALNDKGKPLELTIQPKTVDVVYQPVIQQKTFSKLQPEVKGLESGRKALLPQEGVAVTLEGNPADLATIRPETIRIVVDVTGLGPGEYLREATVTLPATVRLAGGEPLRVPVKIVAQ
ncbi:CdaR family protein [Effusibacillus pohliae]|uniref:CdaR family protein n=1 Tax=Effusibacillus pohliae TaxID=232270 RepID=UPI000372BFAA|nr:CdaR family protein [Effusibacillus pohliae]